MNKGNIKIMYLGAAVAFIICQILVVLLGSGYLANDKRPRCIYRTAYELDASILYPALIEWYETEGIDYIPVSGDAVKIINISDDNTCVIIDNSSGSRARTFATKVPLSALVYSPSEVENVRNIDNSSCSVTIQRGTSLIASLFVALSVISLALFFVVNIPILAEMFSRWITAVKYGKYRRGFILNTSFVVISIVQILWAIFAG